MKDNIIHVDFSISDQEKLDEEKKKRDEQINRIISWSKHLRIDNKGKSCNCGGEFKETEFHDDMHGVLHCDTCNNRIQRYNYDDE